MDKMSYTPEQISYLKLLAEKYPTVQTASTEVINLKAIMGLPKGTEHFISDIHGEYEAFTHIINSCSGVIKEKMDSLFNKEMTRRERDELATLIYYPEEKMKLNPRTGEDLKEWQRLTLHRLIMLARIVTSKYTVSKVRKSISSDYLYLIDELIYMSDMDENRQDYYDNILDSIIETDAAPGFIVALCTTIKTLAADHLHIVGDIFDRGPRADKVMDQIMIPQRVDIQWGNHDVLWMGAACGSRTLVATVVSNSIHYNNLQVLEAGYGISLRPLSVFANEVYNHCNLDRFKVSLVDGGHVSEKDMMLSARMHKAITIILFKLEGQKIQNRPEFGMQDRLLLDKIDFEKKTVLIKGQEYPLEDCDFPTVDPADPYKLTEDEESVINQLVDSFRHSAKLQEHVHFLYSKGSVYKAINGNLLLHGSIPMKEDGEFLSFHLGGKDRCGKDLLDYLDRMARQAYYEPIGSLERQIGMDYMWWLWGGRNSPIFGREQLTTFERRLIADKKTWEEPKNPYYRLYEDPEVCSRILEEFGLDGKKGHIINGHVPVKAGKGESPIKGGGRLIVIDGGFCKAYQPTSGIAGYTLIFNSHCIRIVAHQPFAGKKRSIQENLDIANDSLVFETMDKRMMIADTDEGKILKQRIYGLTRLIEAYRNGAVREKNSEYI